MIETLLKSGEIAIWSMFILWLVLADVEGTVISPMRRKAWKARRNIAFKVLLSVPWPNIVADARQISCKIDVVIGNLESTVVGDDFL